MKPSIPFQQHRNQIKDVVLRHNVLNPRVIGAVLHGTDTEDSALDILVDPTEETSLFDIGGIHVELTELLGVHVNVFTPNALPDRWKATIINEAQAV